MKSEFSSLLTYKRIKKMLRAVNILFRKLNIHKMGKSDLRNLGTFVFNKNSYSGFDYDVYCNIKIKGKTFDMTFKISKRKWDYINNCITKEQEITRTKFYSSIYTIGATKKKDRDYKNSQSLAYRAGYMSEFHIELNSTAWIDPITQ